LEESANVLAQEFDLDVFISSYNHSALGLQGIKATMTRKASTLAYLRWLAFLLALFLALPVNAYDNIPISASAIRDAYFLGTRQGGLTPDVLAPYAHWIAKREPARHRQD